MLKINWKQRAINRRIEIKKLKKRIKELAISRDSWKLKAIERIESINQQKKYITAIKKNVQKIMQI